MELIRLGSIPKKQLYRKRSIGFRENIKPLIIISFQFVFRIDFCTNQRKLINSPYRFLHHVYDSVL